MAENDFTTPDSLGVAIYDLHDVKALIEAAESQLESDGNSSTVRVLRIAFAKLSGVLEGKDYDTRAKVIQNIRTGMAQTPDVEALTAMLSSYLKTWQEKGTHRQTVYMKAERRHRGPVQIIRSR
jgi:hypothetical protein